MQYVNWARDIIPILKKHGIGYQNQQIVIVNENEPGDEELAELYEGLLGKVTSAAKKVATAYNQGTQVYDEKQIEMIKQKQKQQDVMLQNTKVINNLINKLAQTQKKLQTI